MIIHTSVELEHMEKKIMSMAFRPWRILVSEPYVQLSPKELAAMTETYEKPVNKVLHATLDKQATDCAIAMLDHLKSVCLMQASSNYWSRFISGTPDEQSELIIKTLTDCRAQQAEAITPALEILELARAGAKPPEHRGNPDS